MLKSHNSRLVADLMKVLGIDSLRVVGFMLRVTVGEPIILEVETLPDEPTGEVELKRYRITKEEIAEAE